MSSTLSPRIRRPSQFDAGADLSDVIEAIGDDAFGHRVASCLNRICGADHFAAYALRPEGIEEVSSGSADPDHSAREAVTRYVGEQWWRRDPAMSGAKQSLRADAASIIHVDFADRHYAEIRRVVFPSVRERLLVFGGCHDAAVCLSIIRCDPRPEFEAVSVEQVNGMAGLLIATLTKHAEVVAQHSNVALALTALDEIEQCIVAISELPRREVEVCARVLYGMSTVGISLDLGVGEESVKTYRKRAYQRLQLGSERELLTWYLALWSDWRVRHFKLRASRPAERLRSH